MIIIIITIIIIIVVITKKLEVGQRKKNLALAFYDYQKAYDMVTWLDEVYSSQKIKERWHTRLEVRGNGK